MTTRTRPAPRLAQAILDSYLAKVPSADDPTRDLIIKHGALSVAQMMLLMEVEGKPLTHRIARITYPTTMRHLSLALINHYEIEPGPARS
jgi:hypothetical protein